MFLIVLGCALAAIFATAVGLFGFHVGYALAEKRHLASIVDTEQDMRVRVLGELWARIDAGDEPLTIEFYEKHALSTVASTLYGTPGWFHHLNFKLFGEAGEFAEHVGKASRDDGWDIFDGPQSLLPERRMALLKELGDILWYVVTIAKELGSNLAEVALINIKKHDGRKQRGTLKGAGDDR